MIKVSSFKGDCAIFASASIFSVASIIVKYISVSFSGLFITLMRFLIGIGAGVFILMLQKRRIRINDPQSWFMRGLFGSVSMCAFYYAITMTGSGRAVLLSNTYPVFVALFGFLFFKQTISLSDCISLLLCITGCVFVLYDGSNYRLIGDCAALLSAVTSGVAIHYIKKSSESDHPIVVYLATCFFGLIIAPTTFHEWQSVDYKAGSILVLLGLIVFFAQIIMTWGYRYVSATRGSIMSYFGIPLTIILSACITGEQFKSGFFLGLSFIIIGLIVNTLRLQKSAA